MITGAPAGASAMVDDVLVVENLSKRFGGAPALKSVDFRVQRGEVHGLLGSNGSGKSTLIKILAGFHEPEPGARIGIFGREMALPITGERAKSAGLAFVHQNLGLIPSLSVTENLLLTRLATEAVWVLNWRHRHRTTAEILSRYGLNLSPAAPVSALSAAEQALLAIVRAVEDLGPADASGRGRLLVLDEPTPFLPKVGVDQLFALVRRVVSEGASVVFVSHNIAEVMEITDRATILRDGAVADVLHTRRASETQFVEAIIGRSLKPFQVQRLGGGARLPAAEIRGLVAPGLGPVSFTVGKGETVGLTGLIGSGFDRVGGALFGKVRAASGMLTIGDGRSIAVATADPARAIAQGVIYLPADRLGEAGVGSLPVVENEMLPVLPTMRGFYGLDFARMVRTARDLGAAFDVRPNLPALPLAALSGGNQQKALLAKWLQTKPKLVLLDEPTQGVDVGARQQVYAALDAAGTAGAGIVVASTDFEQLAQICHRVLVFSRGQVVTELNGADVAKDTIAECCYRSMTRIA